MGNYICSRAELQEELRKYKEAYTPEETELNKRLYEECSKEPIDFVRVEELLKQGADPLGNTGEFDWSFVDHIYGELVMESQENESIHLPRITELFLKYGMNVTKPRVPYDGNDSLHPLWGFTFVINEHAIKALKMLLDHGLSADDFAEFWDHSMMDFFHCDCGDPQNDEFWNDACTWTFKGLLLGASYDHILNDDEVLREFICCDFNTYDIHNFRNWDDYEYYYDTSSCERRPELYGSIIHIYKKDTKEEVWTIGVGNAGRKVLKHNTD